MKNMLNNIGKFTYKVWSKFLDVLGNIKIFKYPMFIVYDSSYFQMSGEKILEAAKLLKPGDVVLRGYDHYLDGHFIKGDYSHAAVYIGNNTLVHAVSPTVCKIHLVDFMECDRIAIYRPKKYASSAAAAAKKYSTQDIPYDFGFDTEDTSRLYCFELIAKCFPKFVFKKYIQKKLFGLLKREVYLSKSFIESQDLSRVFEYNPRKHIDFSN